MIILALAGLWALAFGRITITTSLSLEGLRAIILGLVPLFREKKVGTVVYES